MGIIDEAVLGATNPHFGEVEYICHSSTRSIPKTVNYSSYSFPLVISGECAPASLSLKVVFCPYLPLDRSGSPFYGPDFLLEALDVGPASRLLCSLQYLFATDLCPMYVLSIR